MLWVTAIFPNGSKHTKSMDGRKALRWIGSAPNKTEFLITEFLIESRRLHQWHFSKLNNEDNAVGNKLLLYHNSITRGT